jgi:regulator of replication initiation timing
VNVIEDILTEETAVRLAADRIRERLAGVLSEDAQVVDEKVKYYPADNSRIRVEVVFEALEDIGMEERIELNTGRIEVE